MNKEINMKEVERFVKPFYAKRDPMHNWKHIQRIQKKVAFLKKQYKNINNDFLTFLIYFHGSRKWAKKNKKAIITLGYPSLWINKINKPTTREGRIVWDANCLENVGEYGIKKTLEMEKYYKQTRKETLKIAKKYQLRYRFYTPLGKKLGNQEIDIKKWWLQREMFDLEKKNKENEWKIKILVNCLVFYKNNLLIIRRVPKDAQGGKWDFPGGNLDDLEEIDQGMKREIKEEIGVSVNEVERVGLKNVRRKEGRRHYLLLFFKTNLKTNKISLSAEHDSYKWINPKNLFNYKLNWIFPASKKLLYKELK